MFLFVINKILRQYIKNQYLYIPFKINIVVRRTKSCFKLFSLFSYPADNTYHIYFKNIWKVIRSLWLSKFNFLFYILKIFFKETHFHFCIISILPIFLFFYIIPALFCLLEMKTLAGIFLIVFRFSEKHILPSISPSIHNIH